MLLEVAAQQQSPEASQPQDQKEARQQSPDATLKQ
jgi:hypothetical protein